MLVLTRTIGERLVIGEGDSKIIVTLLDLRGNQARIGVDAPRHLPVHREEIYERIQAERAAAACEEPSYAVDDDEWSGSQER